MQLDKDDRYSIENFMKVTWMYMEEPRGGTEAVHVKSLAYRGTSSRKGVLIV